MCWAHNPKVLGSSPGPRTLDHTSDLDYNVTTLRTSPSTTTSNSPQNSRGQSTRHVLSFGQSLDNATRPTSLPSSVLLPPTVLTSTRRSEVISDHTITTRISARDTSSRPVAYLQTPTSSYWTSQLGTKTLVRGYYTEHVSTAPGQLFADTIRRHTTATRQ